MVSRFMLAVMFVGSVAAAATDDVDTAGMWPAEVSYRGKRRSAEWLDDVFLHFRSKLVQLDGAWALVARDRWLTRLRPGDAGLVRVTPVKVLADDDFLVRLAERHTMGEARVGGTVGPDKRPQRFHDAGQVVRLMGAAPPDGRNSSGKQWILRVAGLRNVTVGSQRVVACIPLPDKAEPLSRQQFLNCLESGFRLYEWRWKYKPLRPRGKIATWYRRYVK